MTLAQLALLVPWVAVVIGALRPVTDNSYLWHIRAGDLQVASGSVLTVDPFSFTMGGEPWLTQSWLADVLYSWLHGHFGLAYTGGMVLVVATLTMAGAGVVAYRFSRSVPVTAGLVFLTALLFAPAMVPRPVVFSFLTFLLVVLAWEERELRWTLPFLFWLWASLHGSFILGFAYVGLRWIAEREWRTYPYLVAVVLPTLLTPHGWGLAAVVTDFVTARPYLALMSEWRTPDFLTPELAPFLVGLVLLLVGGMRGHVAPVSLWVVVPFLILAMSASRAVFPAWIALVPIVAAGLDGVSFPTGRGFGIPVAGAAFALILLMPFLEMTPSTLDPSIFPVTASSRLIDVPTWHDDRTGGYFIYTGHFEGGVFIDDRVELYRERIAELIEVRAGVADWVTVFKRDRIGQALVAAGGPLHGLLTAGGWREYYRDARYVVLRPE